MSWREEFHDIRRRKEQVIDCTHWPTTYLQRTYACTADKPTYNLHSYKFYTLRSYIHPYTTNLHCKPTRAYTLPTYQPYKSPYTLHTDTTLHTYKPLHAYIPTKHYNPYTLIQDDVKPA